MDKINYIKIAYNFNLQEFECPCCKRVMLHSDLLKKLVRLRQKIHEPLIINSGYRCPEENKKAGGVPTSYHLFGMAADVTAKLTSITDLLQYAIDIGFYGIGRYENFLHLDVRPTKSRWEDPS